MSSDGKRVGATEQKKIDLEKACEWLKENADKYIYDAEVSRYQPPQLTISGKCWEDFRKAMEGISGNDKEIPSNSCNSDKNLQELTWGDIQCILDIAEGVKEDISLKKLMDMDPVDYCVEILKRFKENK